MIELCGDRNIFSELHALAAPVSLEAVLARDPQAIVTGSDPGAAARFREWRHWPQISAVKTGACLAFPVISWPAPRREFS